MAKKESNTAQDFKSWMKTKNIDFICNPTWIDKKHDNYIINQFGNETGLTEDEIKALDVAELMEIRKAYISPAIA